MPDVVLDLIEAHAGIEHVLILASGYGVDVLASQILESRRNVLVDASNSLIPKLRLSNFGHIFVWIGGNVGVCLFVKLGSEIVGLQRTRLKLAKPVVVTGLINVACIGSNARPANSRVSLADDLIVFGIVAS